jgi:Amt family ammonium transporter
LEGKPTLIGACVGAIAGLATITPAAGFVDPWSALLIGFLCVPFCYACIEITKRYKLDDALDVWAVHGMGGFLGTVCVGIFATEKVSGNVDASGKQFLIQLLAASGIAVYSFVIGYLLIKVIDKFSKVAVDADTYAKGLDVSIHGHEAYFDSSNDGSKKVVGV